MEEDDCRWQRATKVMLEERFTRKRSLPSQSIKRLIITTTDHEISWKYYTLAKNNIAPEQLQFLFF